VPQTVTVTGVDDSHVDGNIAYTVITAPASSADPSYNGRDATDVSVTNFDNDTSLPVDTRPPNQRFVARVYLDLLQRPVDPSGLAFFASRLDQGTPRVQVVREITSSPEYRAKLVQTLYRELLGRGTDPGGLETHVGFLARGGTIDQLKVSILSSPEYLARAGGTIDAFLAALYRDVLRRAVDPAGALAHGGFLARGGARAVVCDIVLNSREAAQNLVQDIYRRFLRRFAEESGLNGWIGAKFAGLREEEIISQVIASGEYFARAVSIPLFS
jgi:hypothetical protein